MLYVLLRQSVAHQLIFNLTLESKWCLSGGTAHWRNKLSKCFQQNDSRRLSQTECSSSVRPAKGCRQTTCVTVTRQRNVDVDCLIA
ncbi:hypothetical protein J6590_106744 [Homalodisca vitripennis]|nr:hypothetical protein J6590_106744 [Homalodisca vitripennis]